MIDLSRGSSHLELAFLVLQGLGALLFAVALVAVRRPLVGLRALHAVLCVCLPLLWLWGWPVSSGIDGAGRFLVGAPSSLLTGLLGLGWVVVAARRAGQRAWAVAWPSTAAVGACVAIWVVFVMQ